MKSRSTAIPAVRLKLAVRGAVQGVGFRPFIYRLATELGLAGWVNNTPQGLFIEVEGARAELERFRLRVEKEKPARSFIQSSEASWLDPKGYPDFEIRESESSGDKTAIVLPDLATCAGCRREILDPTNRRYRYPFTNCTHCGPRFSIIESLPYDRASTSMKAFKMCPACQAEYDDPADRRFHAQPNACPVCGPRLQLWDPAGEKLSECDLALRAAADAIRQGRIVAVKGLGGFHFILDARNDAAVRGLRERKQREEKPLALMFPTLENVEAHCEVSPLEGGLLLSPEAPIVLLPRRSTLNSQLSTWIAPGNPNLGVMLPSNPLHHLLMAELGFPVVATSGNLSDEPICTDEREAVERLRAIADVFLVHNRPIIRHVDDSISRVMLDREMVLRRARGYAPLPVTLKSEIRNPKSKIVLAVGAHLKNSVALAVGDQVFLSQHIGDLETEQANMAFRRVAADLPRLYDTQPEVMAADLHPDYVSTRFAEEASWPARVKRSDDGALGVVSEPQALSRSAGHRSPNLIRVQHHVAHVLSCMAENELSPPVLGVSWDGTGYGLDGTIWGGEFFLVEEHDFKRFATLRPFPLPGGDLAIKEPRRSALGLLQELAGGDDNLRQRLQQKVAAYFSSTELSAIRGMLARRLNSPQCSSIGRLFDVVASLVNLRQRIRFEGQAAMELEFSLAGVATAAHYDLSLVTCREPVLLDWSTMIEAILADRKRGVAIGKISAKFHNALAEAILSVARRTGEPRVVLSGGCFQNRYLTEQTVKRLRAEGFQPYWHQRVPPNDGGIALGQIIAARRASG